VLPRPSKNATAKFIADTFIKELHWLRQAEPETGDVIRALQARGVKVTLDIISLQLCKMNDARASHINANQGTIKAVNTSKLNTKSCKYIKTKH
jgi:hypothetical protein